MASIAAFSEFKAFAIKSPLILSAVSFLVVAAFVRYLLSRPKRLDLPVVGSPDTKNWQKELIKGTLKYPDTPFILALSPPMVILPISLMNEVRNLPDHIVSFMGEVRRMFMSRHTGIGEERPEVTAAVKVDLTRHIASLLSGLQDEARYALNQEFGPCEDWTPIAPYGKLARIVALLSGRVFVGRPLSREEEWIDSTTKFAADCAASRLATLKWKIWLRPFVAPFIPEIRRLNRHKSRGAQLLAPILKECLAKAQNEKPQDDDFEDEQGVFISWILSHTHHKERADPLVLANNQMMLSFAAIHTTTMAVCHAVYDIACRPEYIEPLREEINKVLQEDGYDIDGEGFLQLKKTSMSKLRKLDSFLKETQRLSPPGFISNVRLVHTDLTLPTGHTLPKGTRFALPSYIVHTSPTTETFSPTYNPPGTKPPTEFDGFRFSNLRSMPGKENKHQFVTTSPDSLNFGYGNHACPGRFFAGNEIKVILIELLRNWDIRLKGDTEGKGGEDKRPENIVQEFSVMPNMVAEIEFRRRKDQEV
ncbi:hypothetical protein G7Y89_g4629 [Cudoniella acicularis]|uniref:Cytochrome P450 n=1 Tax=Cudoniella acicularis TaxID=354080 RepID=A0A8H4RR34_9HELO|nr:hypothetical protein G7Y89_g4629 [Cudoniella acicularis]